MSEGNSASGKCSVCLGTGQPGPNDTRCICQGAGTHEAEVEGLRALADALRREFHVICVTLTRMGYKASMPSHILPAIEALHKRCQDAEEEYVKLKRQRVL